MRGFKIARGFEDYNLNLPVRKTKYSAGYDIECAEEIIIEPFKLGCKPTLIKTGIKAYMEDDEYLMLSNRSSNPQNGLVLANGVGIVDKDYYENLDNDGAIMFAFYNIKDEPITVRKGQRIGQAIFMKYLTVENDNAIETRTGGFGSTNKKDC